MIWQVWADIVVGLSVPVLTLFLYLIRRIQTRHVWMVAWGFAVGSTWEFTNYYLGSSYHAMKVPWPMPLITLHILHTFWDAGLFIIGYWLCVIIMRPIECCRKFSWHELAIMWVWGVAQEFVVELMGNGVIWEYQVRSWNPVWLTIGAREYTLVPQLIWAIAPIVYYLGILKINSLNRKPR